MQFILKRAKGGKSSNCVAVVQDSGRSYDYYVNSGLAIFVNKHKNGVLVSTTPFPGCKIAYATKWGLGWHFDLGTGTHTKIWACTNKLNQLGIAMSKMKRLYFKANG